jgi:siroheme synthase (precorrin-2 oxidase/ferrochelatase)
MAEKDTNPNDTPEPTFPRHGRDYEEASYLLEAASSRHAIPALTDNEVSGLVSKKAQETLIELEVGDRSTFEMRFSSPYISSNQGGVTVGIGYDLGFRSVVDVRRDLEGLLPPDYIEALTRAVSIRGDHAKSRLAEYRAVRVPWDVAVFVFERAILPRIGREVLRTFPNAVEIRGDAFGALALLIFDRGTALDGDRRVEMRAIRDLMERRAFDAIPHQFRQMKRQYLGTTYADSASKRREVEATMFQDGLSELARQASVETAKFTPFATLQRIVKLASRIAAIRDARGQTVATGILVDGTDWGLPAERSYVLTNAHVVRDGGAGMSALQPSDARIVFEAEAMAGAPHTYRCARVIWQSQPDAHDAVLFELDRPVPTGVAPLPIARADVRLLVEGSEPFESSQGTQGTRLAVIGHARGGALSLQSAGTVGEQQAELVDMGPRTERAGPGAPIFLHYTAPTEPGHSGSPVFETEDWTVVALHHAGPVGTDGRPRLNGKPGKNFASEGIAIRSILTAARRQLDWLDRARAWAAAGKPRARLMSPSQLKAFAAQIAAEPLSSWLVAEIAPYVAASRRALPEKRARRLRALAACLALVPLVVAVGAERWIARASVELSPPMQITRGRIDRFLDPAAKAPGPVEQARAVAASWLVPPHAHATAIRDLALSSDSTLAAVLSADNVVRLWELETGRMRWEHVVETQTNRAGNSIQPFAVGLVDQLNGPPAPPAVVVATNADDPNSPHVLSSMDGTPVPLNLFSSAQAAFAPRHHLTLPAGVTTRTGKATGMVVASSGRDEATQDRIVGRADGRVQWAGSAEVVHALRHAAPVRAAAMSADGKLAAKPDHRI